MKLKRQSVDLRRFLGTEIPQSRLSPDLRQRVRHALASSGDLSGLTAEVARELLARHVFERAGVIRHGSETVPVYSLPGSPRVYDLRALMGSPRDAVSEGPSATAMEESEPPAPGPGPEQPPAEPVRLGAIDAIRRTLERDWVSFGLESSLEGLLDLLSGNLDGVELRVVLWSDRLGVPQGQGRGWRVLDDGRALDEAFRRSLEAADTEAVTFEGRQWLPLRVNGDVVGAVGSSRPLSIETRAMVARTLEALLMAHRRSQQRVYSDPLTGLHNRRFFENQLGLELERSLRTGQPLALLFVDLDHFKRVNDERGHEVGDLVLQHAARLMLQHLRRIDQVFRWGGEEFALLLPGTGRDDALHTADRLRGVIERTPLILPGDGRVPLTVSIGVALAPEHAQGGERALLRHADQALYRAKESGRNRVCLYGNGDAERSAAG